MKKISLLFTSLLLLMAANTAIAVDDSKKSRFPIENATIKSIQNMTSKSIDSELIAVMKASNVPVVGYAIIQNYKIVSAKTISLNPGIKVTNDSLFQAASISKSVSAYGALKLVSQGKINLDKPVNQYLLSWKIPANDFEKSHPVTLRLMLDMTSGLAVSGFPGHAQGEKLPTLLEVLNGTPPSNTPAVRVFEQPGKEYFYSGGAYEVLEQLVEDVTHKPFSAWMQAEILDPLNMSHSVYQYPLNDKLSATAIPGFLLNNKMIPGGWNNYAIAGAGGLWSTPSDLAKFAIDISLAYLGKNNHIISRSVAIDMLTRQQNTDYGLGVAVNGEGRTLNFRKNGHNLGYHNQLIMFPNTGDGVVIMTDSENGEYVFNYLIPLIAEKYQWPCFFPFYDELVVFPKRAC